jgi:hypothetical protein
MRWSLAERLKRCLFLNQKMHAVMSDGMCCVTFTLIDSLVTTRLSGAFLRGFWGTLKTPGARFFANYDVRASAQAGPL